jgi:hypothetical protein
VRGLLDSDDPRAAVVSRQLSPGRSATVADLQAARERERLLLAELPRVREAATAWRNGLGGLLAALVGFSLIRGRSDIGELATPWAVLVGILLLAALIIGAVGALLLIRAANGRPSVASTRQVLSRPVADHIESLAAAAALRRGIVLTLACAGLLVAAVGATWYGPAHGNPAVLIVTPNGIICGSVVRVGHNDLALNTAVGEVTTDMASISGMQAVVNCPNPG